jgi:hypothetical protein
VSVPAASVVDVVPGDFAAAAVLAAAAFTARFGPQHREPQQGEPAQRTAVSNGVPGALGQAKAQALPGALPASQRQQAAAAAASCSGGCGCGGGVGWAAPGVFVVHACTSTAYPSFLQDGWLAAAEFYRWAGAAGCSQPVRMQQPLCRWLA